MPNSFNPTSLLLCHSCGRHVHFAADPLDTSCPFCGALFRDHIAAKAGCDPAQCRQSSKAMALIAASAMAISVVSCADVYGGPGDYYKDDIDTYNDAQGSDDAGQSKLDSDGASTKAK